MIDHVGKPFQASFFLIYQTFLTSCIEVYGITGHVEYNLKEVVVLYARCDCYVHVFMFVFYLI